jgi:putative drug exporter of the RND superfamily
VSGLTSTARVISAAAAIMVVVFLSFDLTPDVSVKQVGLGKANWWLPLALARVFMVQPERGNHVTKPLLKTGNHA